MLRFTTRSTGVTNELHIHVVAKGICSVLVVLCADDRDTAELHILAPKVEHVDRF